jgi:hypothetical protein
MHCRSVLRYRGKVDDREKLEKNYLVPAAAEVMDATAAGSALPKRLEGRAWTRSASLPSRDSAHVLHPRHLYLADFGSAGACRSSTIPDGTVGGSSRTVPTIKPPIVPLWSTPVLPSSLLPVHAPFPLAFACQSCRELGAPAIGVFLLLTSSSLSYRRRPPVVRL